MFLDNEIKKSSHKYYNDIDTLCTSIEITGFLDNVYLDIEKKSKFTEKSYMIAKAKELNKEKIRAYSRARYEANKEKISEYKKLYYIANRERLKKRNKEYYEANKERLREYNRAAYHSKKFKNKLSEDQSDQSDI